MRYKYMGCLIEINEDNMTIRDLERGNIIYNGLVNEEPEHEYAKIVLNKWRKDEERNKYFYKLRKDYNI